MKMLAQVPAGAIPYTPPTPGLRVSGVFQGQSGVWYRILPGGIQEFPCKPRWIDTLEKINEIISKDRDENSCAVIVGLVEGIYQAAGEDYLKGRQDRAVLEFLSKQTLSQADRNTLIEIFLLKQADNAAQEVGPHGNAVCSENFKFDLILRHLRS